MGELGQDGAECSESVPVASYAPGHLEKPLHLLCLVIRVLAKQLCSGNDAEGWMRM